MSEVSSYYIGVEFVTGSFTAVTDEVTTFAIGRQMGDMLGGLFAAEAQVQIKNDDGTLGRDIALRPNVAVRIRATEAGSERTLFSGRVDDWSADPAINAGRFVTLSARDELKCLVRETISTSLRINTNVGSLFQEVISETDVGSFVIDQFAARLPFHWVRETLATEAITGLLGTDNAYAYIDAEGTLIVKGHYFANLAAAVSSLDDASSGSNVLQMPWSTNDDQVYNNVFVDTIPRAVATTVTTITALPDVLTIPASAGISFTLTYIDPVNKEAAPATDVITPVASLDWFVSVDETEATHRMDTTSLAISIGGGTLTASLFNGFGQDVQLRRFFVRGKPVLRLSDLRTNAANSASQAEFGRLDFTHTNEFIGNQLRAQAFAEYLADIRGDPLPLIDFVTRNRFPFILDRTLGEVVHVVNSFLGVGSDFWISGIEHTVTADEGWTHDTRYSLNLVEDQDLLILDDTEQGSLDSTHELGF